MRPAARGRPIRPVRPGRFRLAAVAAVASAGLSLAGCSFVRNDLGTRSSSCYVAIPAAFAAVHHHGFLHGVRLVGVATLRTRVPALYRAGTAGGQRNVCLVAFTGHYARSDLVDPAGRVTGHLAIVELGYPGSHVLQTLLLTHQPVPFGHTHILPP